MNPYQPPQPGHAPYAYPYGQPMPSPEERRRLVRIANDQRMINYVVLAYLGVGGLARGAAGADSVGVVQAVAGVAILCVIVTGIIYAVSLAKALHGTGWAVLFAILLLVPCVGLLGLLVLNSQATRELKKAGLRVGLLGADASQFQGW